MNISHVTLKVPVAGIEHVVPTLQAILELDLRAQVTVEIDVMADFPPPSISPEDQKALDAALQGTKDALAKASALSTDPPK